MDAPPALRQFLPGRKIGRRGNAAKSNELENCWNALSAE
jgi:hypothetical protein